jgi:hypothetical protein
LYAAKTKENHVTSGGQSGRGKVYPNSDEPIKPFHTLPELAKIAGVLPDTLNRAEIILTKGTEKLKEEARSGRLSIAAAFEIAHKTPLEEEIGKRQGKRMDLEEKQLGVSVRQVKRQRSADLAAQRVGW